MKVIQKGQPDSNEHPRAQGDRFRELHKIIDTHITIETAIHTKDAERDQANHHHDGQTDPQARQMLTRDGMQIEAEQKGSDKCRDTAKSRH